MGNGGTEHASRETAGRQAGKGGAAWSLHQQDAELRGDMWSAPRQGRGIGQRHRGSLCLRNDDKSQAVWVALAAHESPCRNEEIYSPGRGIYNCLGLQKTLCAGTRSGSHTDAPHATAPSGAGVRLPGIRGSRGTPGGCALGRLGPNCHTQHKLVALASRQGSAEEGSEVTCRVTVGGDPPGGDPPPTPHPPSPPPHPNTHTGFSAFTVEDGEQGEQRKWGSRGSAPLR